MFPCIYKICFIYSITLFLLNFTKPLNLFGYSGKISLEKRKYANAEIYTWKYMILEWKQE